MEIGNRQPDAVMWHKKSRRLLVLDFIRTHAGEDGALEHAIRAKKKSYQELILAILKANRGVRIMFLPLAVAFD